MLVYVVELVLSNLASNKITGQFPFLLCGSTSLFSDSVRLGMLERI